jgi:regulator of protease activity HflC (stomatin/prohibitin superfamily)
MKEIILSNKKNGMLVLILTILVIIATFAIIIWGAIISTDEAPSAILIVGLVLMCICWIPLLGLKVLKPQEALVLTLFGKYVGTLKGDGFYWVNPFCTSFNPASKTKLNQSGDVMQAASVFTVTENGSTSNVSVTT